MMRLAAALLCCALLAGCAGRPLTPWSADGPPLIVAPVATAGVSDGRGRFREIACAVIEARGPGQPGYQPCAEALTEVGDEPGATGAPVELGPSRRGLVGAMVPGVGWDCVHTWLGLDRELGRPDEPFGYRAYVVEVEGLSGSAHNARLLRDHVLAEADRLGERRLVLIGYSKGAPDILEAVATYPEIRPYLAAVVSLAGAVGGSPLANDATEKELDLMRHLPQAECSRGDDGAVASLRPAARRAWLANHPLPGELPFYSVVTLPQPERVSAVLRRSYGKLARIDPHNDGQVIAWDQVIPGGTLVGFLNADHWAVAIPVAESHPLLGRTFVNHNAYPWRAVLEAVMRFVEEDLDRRDGGG